ncbi:uncharacterized protein [Porites lutea]|uniref:uncharacterized protein isoform X2 n=1 Tax=Porites lutea TaxID=51062 RepID=UPI003CC5BF5B
MWKSIVGHIINWVNSLFLLVGLSTFTTVQTTMTSPADPMSEDLVVRFYDKNISTQELLIKLNMTRHSFSVNNLCPSSRFSCETVCPLNESSEARERMFQKPCYCDTLCLELGDCCYDYFVRCVDDKIRKRDLSRHVCVKTSKKGGHGYALIDSCPSDNSDRSLESLCSVSSSSLELPVIDLHDNSLYKNFFCAKCNNAYNPVYWNFSASCKRNFIPTILGDNPYSRKMMLDFIIKNCDWEFTVPRISSNLKNCLSVKVQCKESVPENLLLSSLCSFYAFPVCKDIQRKNPHCEMCRGNDISELSCVCYPGPSAGDPGPSLDILFDFSSPSDHTITIGDIKTTVKNKECSYGFVFDPLSEECVQMYAPENVVGLSVTNNGSVVRYNCKGQASGTASSRSSKIAFIKYHIYAWTCPAIIVITSSVLDTSNAVFIGYGERLCWISNGKALLVVLGIPVALLLTFNCVAIYITLLSIWKVQKATRRVTDQRTNLPVLYIKLSSALGFTWLLGFIYPFAKVEFLAYLFVICNSLQGFFIFLAFVANKRTLVKMKGAWRLPSKSDGSTNTTSNTGKNKTTNRNKNEELALTTVL